MTSLNLSGTRGSSNSVRSRFLGDFGRILYGGLMLCRLGLLMASAVIGTSASDIDSTSLLASVQSKVLAGVLLQTQLGRFGRVYRDAKTASALPGETLRRRDHSPVRSVVPAILAHLSGPRGDDGGTAPLRDHVTIWRWVQRYAPVLNRRIRREMRPPNRSWRVDETYVKVAGNWAYLYRASTLPAKRSSSCCRPSAI